VHFLVELNFSRRLSDLMKSDPPWSPSSPLSDVQREKVEKAARLAQALRDNLRRRKAGRATPPDKDSD